MVTTRSQATGAFYTSATSHQAHSKRRKRANDSPPPSNKRSRQKTGASASATTASSSKGKGKKGKGRNEGEKSESKTHPPTVLEKGIFYFFIRARVDINTPKKVADIARSYLVLHPVPLDGHVDEEDAPLASSSKSRLLALPKKVLPGSAKDRFLTFVEKVDASPKELKDGLLRGEDYETKTVGRRHRPGAMPVGEGVYVLTRTERESHLSYVVTVSAGEKGVDEMSSLHKALRLKNRGSFIVSSRNPKFEAPKGARVPDGPEYPKRVLDKFDNLRWAPTEPEFMDYARAQMLLIGDTTALGKEVKNGAEAETEADAQDDKDDKETDEDTGADGDDEGDGVPGVLNQLESEHIQRMKQLSADDADAIYADLHSRALAHSGSAED
ncbi:hypothetical protein E4U21_000444 [Claviceps maximensis]|nr:hypothetical protein E4U21_000444 [Claviceps maximensis]